MAVGRCSGCGEQGASAKVAQHVLNCAKYLALFRADPDRALLPEAEYERYLREDRSQEAKAAAKEERNRPEFERQDRQRARQQNRWAKPKDILAD